MDLKTVKSELPDQFMYRRRKFIKSNYSMSTYSTREYPGRSEEIIWKDKDGNEIYLFRDDIEYIKM